MEIRCKSRKQLAAEFGINPKTFRRLLQRHDLDLPSGLLTPEWVEKIYQTLGRPIPPLVVAAISFALLSVGCKKPTLNPTPIGLEIEYLGANWDLSLCSKFHEELKNAELEISVDRYTGDVNNPIENFKTYFHDINNDTNDADNRIFKDIEVPTSGPFAISVVIRQVCSDYCTINSSGPHCSGQRGKPRLKGTTSTYNSGAGNPPPAKILIDEKFIQCTSCGCQAKQNKHFLSQKIISMKNKVFFLAISVVLLMISCQKATDEQEENKDFFSVFSRDDLSGITPSADVSIFANGIFGTMGNPSIDLTGVFKNSNGNRIQVETFRINGIDIPLYGPESSNYYDLFVPSNHELSNTVNGFFGSNVTVEVESMALGNFTKTFYLPQKVQMNLGGISEELSKSQNLDITWNADPQNTLPVAILVAYNKGKSRHVNPNLPNQDLQVFRIVPDNGTYTIPSSDLQIFPVGGLVTVNVIRGIQEHVENSNGNHAIINGAAYVTTIEFEVVN